MSAMLVFVAACAWFGWFYDESQYTQEYITITTVALLVAAFIAWIVETITDAIKERNEDR